jgi:hypothetical protein
MTDQRHPHELPRPTFAELARTAIARAVPETRVPEAEWHPGINEVWVCWPMDGRYAYLDLHRHLHWITGEYGVARERVPMRELPLLPGPVPAGAPGARIRLGDLIGEDQRSWHAGSDQRSLGELLERMALELRVRGLTYFGRRRVA